MHHALNITKFFNTTGRWYTTIKGLRIFEVLRNYIFLCVAYFFAWQFWVLLFDFRYRIFPLEPNDKTEIERKYAMVFGS